MPDQPTIEERIARRREREERVREQLAAVHLDGPFDFPRGGFDAIGAIFGGARDRFAVCLRCGSIVVLNDPEDIGNGGAPIERGVRLHTAWHDQLDSNGATR